MDKPIPGGLYFRYSFLYFRKPLPVKANSVCSADLFPWFNFWTALRVVGGPEATGRAFVRLVYSSGKSFNTEGTENTEKGRETIVTKMSCSFFSLCLSVSSVLNPFVHRLQRTVA